MLDSVTVSFPLAFLAGLVSFLSPCVLPVVPGYLTFVSGMTLEELTGEGQAGEGGTGGRARRAAVVHTLLFALGFTLVFMTLGGAASALGQTLNRVLPVLVRVGGVLVVVFGLYLLGVLRFSVLAAERRVHLASRPAGFVGSVAVGMAFGAGWTPCVGPILGTILLYAGMEGTVLRGTLLLGTYALGLALPFLVASAGLGWFLASTASLRRWLLPIQRVAGGFLVATGILMVSGQFATLTRFLAGMGQLINLDLP